MNRRQQRRQVFSAMIAAIAVHSILGAALSSAGRVIGPPSSSQREPIEVEVLPPKPIPEPTPKPEPEPAPEPEPEQPKPKLKRAKKLPRPRPVVSRAPPPALEPAEPAPGPPDPSPPAPVYTLSSDALGTGTVPVAKGKVQKRGPGGTGTGSGGGGSKSGTAAPISVASIAKRAKPIGNTDFMSRKDYPAEAMRLGIEGPVKVRLVVDETGTVVSSRILQTLGYGLDQLALRLARKLRFTPAEDTNGNKVTSVVIWTYTFRLPS